MITEDYVSYETAKLLKGKGFDESCTHVYNIETGRNLEADFYTCRYVYNSWLDKNEPRLIAASTLQMATKWLRDVHNLHIMVDCIGAENYMPTIQFTRNAKDIEIKSKISKIGGNGFDSHEQAIDAAIKYCLENLI